MPKVEFEERKGLLNSTLPNRPTVQQLLDKKIIFKEDIYDYNLKEELKVKIVIPISSNVDTNDNEILRNKEAENSWESTRSFQQ